MPRSYAPEVVADRTGKFYGNALRFPTREEALANVADLAARWMLVTDTRVVESDDPPNYRYEDHCLIPILSDEPNRFAAGAGDGGY